MRFHTAVNKFCYSAALNKPLTVWEDALNQKRAYLGINDAINAILLVKNKGKSGELYNVVTQNYTVQDILDSIKRFTPDIKIQITQSPILNQKSYEVSNEKICSIGFTPQDKLYDNVQETINLFKSIKNDQE